MTKTQSTIANLMAVLLAIPAIAALAIWNGFALSVLWGWFMVPMFALPALSIPAAMGIALIASYMPHQHREFKKATPEQ